jgi:tetratricopeptide (TPR) repeat protein
MGKWRKLLWGVVFVILLIGVIRAQHRQLEQVQRYAPYRDSLYLPTPQYVKLVAIGYDMILADVLWLRSIQAFGAHFTTDRDYRPVYNLFDVITDLDPKFIPAYTFGQMVIGEEGKDFTRSLDLIDKGMLNNPRKYILPYWAGYVCVWDIGDYKRAKYYYGQAVKAPDCPDYVQRILSYIELRWGKYKIAYEKYIEDYLRALAQNSDVISYLTRGRLCEVISKWYCKVLNDAAVAYKEKFGKDIQTLDDLVKGGVLTSNRLPQYEKLLNLIDQYQRRGENLMSHFQEIVQNSMVDIKGIPVNPYGSFYYIRPGRTSGDPDFISDAHDVIDYVKVFINTVRKDISRFKQLHGRYPESLRELYGEEFKSLEPFGGKWIYKPETGEFYSSTVPNI